MEAVKMWAIVHTYVETRPVLAVGMSEQAAWTVATEVTRMQKSRFTELGYTCREVWISKSPPVDTETLREAVEVAEHIKQGADGSYSPDIVAMDDDIELLLTKLRALLKGENDED